MRRFSLPPSDGGKINLLLVSTGSVAAIKIPLLLSSLDRSLFNLIFLPSPSSFPFLPPPTPPTPPTTSPSSSNSLGSVLDCLVFSDADEWMGWTRGDEILHIELRKWADLVLLAPLSANSMGKICAGLCDSLWLEVLRAWDYTTHHTAKNGWKEVACAPAMNTHMYMHPLTAKQLKMLQQELQYTLLGPVEKTLACGDVGTGGMAEVEELMQYCLDARRRILQAKTQLNNSGMAS